MYAHGAQSVKCAVCNHVTPVNAGLGGQSQPRALGGSAEKRPQAVVIQNPSTLDAEGNEVGPLSHLCYWVLWGTLLPLHWAFSNHLETLPFLEVEP